MKIILIEDNQTNLLLLQRLTQQIEGCEPVAFSEPVSALAYAEREAVDLVLVDYVLPQMDGVEVIRRLRGSAGNSEVPIVMVTAETERRVRQIALEAGATDFLSKPIEPIELKARLRNLLALREAHNSLRRRAEGLGAQVARATRAIVEREEELVLRLARATEYRDCETGAHIERIAHYSQIIAEAYGLGPEMCHEIFLASPMHDIGKLGVPDAVLLKPGPLTDQERAIMQTHTVIGYRVLENSSSALIELAAKIALSHHERFDGTGYPRAIAGESIPLAARIVSVADVFDALTSERPYKKAWPVPKAVEYLHSQRGTQFDPQVVDAFMHRLPDVLAIHRDHSPALAVA